MNEIIDDEISIINNKYSAVCVCGKRSSFANKSSALLMLKRGNCRNCKKDYRNVTNGDTGIYQNPEGKWCSICSGCNEEQAYTRKDHAKQSSLGDWQCRKCAAKNKSFSENRAVGPFKALFNKFSRSANDRGIDWGLTEESMFSTYTGKCALTGWAITIEGEVTASLDRIDSSKGYTEDNIQWVHKIVNMCKNKYDQKMFVDMCVAVASKYNNKQP